MFGHRTQNGVYLLLATMLIGLGLLLMVGQLLHISFWRLAWPLLIIMPGLLFFAGMILGGKAMGSLAIPGSIVTIVGLILFYQNILGHWGSWAYLWTLIFPVGVGLGLVVQGFWSEDWQALEQGKRLVKAGLVLFFLLAFFFELIIGFSATWGRIVWPVALIAWGVYLLLRRASSRSGDASVTTPGTGACCDR